jgi:hypothetical protein
MDLLKEAKDKADAILTSKKGSIDPVDGIILFVIVAVVLYILFPILAGVQVATPAIPITSPLYNASVTSQTTIASGASLVSLEALVLAAVVILATVMLLKKHKTE